jgi:hypothetical protein
MERAMFIFFGTKGKTISGKLVEGFQCPSCKNKRFISFGIIRYFHIFWIPTFITSRKVGIECTHCKRTLIGEEISNKSSKQIKAIVFNKQNTIPLFSGLIIITFLFLLTMYEGNKKSVREYTYIEQPAINDIYTVNFNKLYSDTESEYKYGLMKISSISLEKIKFKVSKKAYNKVSGVRKDIREIKTLSRSYYDKDFLYISISELKKLKDSGAIYSIDR